MKLKLKKLHPDAIIPKYQTAGASGLDLHALEDTIIHQGETKIVKTGIAGAVPAGYEIQVRPRSGTSLKTPLRVANSPGTVDSDYRGEISVILNNTTPLVPGYTLPGIEIKKGDRIAQMVVCPVIQAEIEEVTELDETVRGSGGFGSTGK